MPDRTQMHADRLARRGDRIEHGHHDALDLQASGSRKPVARLPTAASPRRPRLARREHGRGAGIRGATYPAGASSFSQTGVPSLGVKVNDPMPRFVPGSTASVSVSTLADGSAAVSDRAANIHGWPSGVVART